MKSLDFQKKLGVMIGVPSTGTWKEKFGCSLLMMMTHFMTTAVEGYRSQQIRFCSVVGSILPRQRRDIVKAMLAQSFSHVLFVDTDQVFPKDTLHRLLAAGKDIVGCNVAVKRIPSCPTARGFDRQPVYTDAGQTGLERVWSVGCGVLLVKREVFEKIGLRCFEIKWRDDIQDYNGEDWGMLDAAREAGFDIWVDHGLSNEVGHVGDFVFTHEVVGEVEQTLPKRAVIG